MQDGVVNPFDGNITFIGVVLESLPVDVKACWGKWGGDLWLGFALLILTISLVGSS